VTADHCAEEQRDEYPTNQLSLEHCDILHTDNDFFFLPGAWDISGASTSRKLPAA
jgi:hypothetical protein